MQTGVKFRCYPTKQQASTLLQWIGAQRFIYNAKVSEDRYFRVFARHSLSHTGEYAPVDLQYAQFKNDELTPWMKQIPSQVLRNGATKWLTAYQRYFKKLGGRPVIQRKIGKQSVWLTREMFEFVPVVNKETGEITTYKLVIGTKKFPLGELEYKAHKAFRIPASIHISIHAGKWHVSFAHEVDAIEPKQEDVIAWLKQFSEVELRNMAQGVDRGVVQPFTLADGTVLDFSETQKKSLLNSEVQARKWQYRASKKQKGSNNQKKAYARLARYKAKQHAIRQDFAHKTSHALVSLQDIWLIVFENLVIQNMTRRAKKKQNKSGRYLKNNAAAKSGLTKSILNSAWGLTKTLTAYKAKRLGKMVLTTPAPFTSQACSHCGHTHPDNRKTQSEFVCQHCGHSENADSNAAKNIRNNGVKQLLSGDFVIEKVKRCKITKSKVGRESSEPTLATESTLVEKVLDMDGIALSVLSSVKQETPSSAGAYHAS